jgi:hypothetical protein
LTEAEIRFRPAAIEIGWLTEYCRVANNLSFLILIRVACVYEGQICWDCHPSGLLGECLFVAIKALQAAVTFVIPVHGRILLMTKCDP